MRIEQFHLFIYSALLSAFIVGVASFISSSRVRFHLRAIFLAFGFGLIIVPGHGEIIIAPLLAAFFPPLRSHLIILGSIYFVVWWAFALFILSRLHYYLSKSS